MADGVEQYMSLMSRLGALIPRLASKERTRVLGTGVVNEMRDFAHKSVPATRVVNNRSSRNWA